ncbi:hypothetical protein ACL02O_16840 [Micromonospora sp. MS34]|uniref:hypothetical protein n=1 Tax=Micromonospora sp. MS34 TaxID=3385971 RepID=UPI0039A29214
MSRPDPPPTRFDDAEKINPFQALVDLHDHATGHPLRPSRDEALTDLALSAAVVSWLSRWQPAMIHAALRAGAAVADVAAATGLGTDEVVHRWERWSDVQTRVVIDGHSLLDPDEVRTIRRRIGRR